MTFSSNIEKVILDNRMRVLVETIPNTHSCALAVVITQGSRDECLDQCGYSHFLEHMIFKGTASRSALEIADCLERRGGYLNAMTGYENTWIEARCLDQHLDLAVDLIGDMISNSVFSPESIVNERKVIIEEIRTIKDTPEELVFDLFFSDLFKQHSLGRSIFGTVSNLKKINQPNIINFYRRKYHYSNVIIGIAGNPSPRVIDTIVDKFRLRSGRIKNRKKVDVLGRGKKRHYKARISQAQLVLGGLSYEADDIRRYAFRILMNILGGGLSSRLFQLLREQQPLVYNIFSFYHTYSDLGVGGIYLSSSSSRISRISDILSVEFEKLRSGDISKTKVEDGKEQLRSRIILGLEYTKARVNKLVNDEIYRKRYVQTEEINDIISSVNSAQINQMAADFFSDNNLIWTYLLPKGGRDGKNKVIR